jgi:hypothetical protein
MVALRAGTSAAGDDLKHLPLDIDLDGSPEHLRTLAAWYREYADQTDRRELVERRLSVAEALEELAATRCACRR